MNVPAAPYHRLWMDTKDARLNPTGEQLNCWGPLETYKRELLRYYGRRYGLRTFVETGTSDGDTVCALHGSFGVVYSIELSRWHYDLAVGLFGHLPNVHLYCGDSGVILREILSTIPVTPALFWLDAHGTRVGPLKEELDAIFEYRNSGVILVDDLQDFWLHDWRSITERAAAAHPDWTYSLVHECIGAFVKE